MIQDLLQYNPGGNDEQLFNNVLLFGYSGSGVSSAVNCLGTSLQPQKTSYITKSLSRTSYPYSPSKVRVTTSYSKINLSTILPQLKTNLWESWGIKDDGSGCNYDSLELDLILQGMLPDRYAMPKDAKALTQVITQQKKPNAYNAIHAVAFMIPQQVVMDLSGSDLTKIKSVLAQIKDRGRDPVVLVSKVDLLVSGQTMGDNQVFDELPEISDVLKITSGLLGVPLANVHAIINYNCQAFEKVTKRLPVLDLNAVRIMSLLLQKCKQFQANDPASLVLFKTLSKAGSGLNLAQSQVVSEVSKSSVISEKEENAQNDNDNDDNRPLAQTKQLDASPEQSKPQKGGMNMGEIFAQAQEEAQVEINVEQSKSAISQKNQDSPQSKSQSPVKDTNSTTNQNALPDKSSSIQTPNSNNTASPNVYMKESQTQQSPTQSSVGKSSAQPQSPAGKQDVQSKATLAQAVVKDTAPSLTQQQKVSVDVPKAQAIEKSTATSPKVESNKSPGSSAENNRQLEQKVNTIEVDIKKVNVQYADLKMVLDSKVSALQSSFESTLKEIETVKKDQSSIEKKFIATIQDAKQSRESQLASGSLSDLQQAITQISQKMSEFDKSLGQHSDNMNQVKIDIEQLISTTDSTVRKYVSEQLEIIQKKIQDGERVQKNFRNDVTRELDEMKSKSPILGPLGDASDNIADKGQSLARGKSAELLEVVNANKDLSAQVEQLKKDITAIKELADAAKADAQKAIDQAQKASSAGCKCVLM
ncbi:hypothetical protein MP228_000045 [Amoeboaphelidium protococcarum]|nr:hypothetical protein MP228_000045 [Amoeboaphelidium protococcarum]